MKRKHRAITRSVLVAALILTMTATALLPQSLAGESDLSAMSDDGFIVMPGADFNITVAQVRVRAYIDGQSVLRINGSEISWSHNGSGAAPGRSGDATLPTVFNDLNYGYDDSEDGVDDGYPWTPKWYSNAQGWESASGEFGALTEGGYSESIYFWDLGLNVFSSPNTQTLTDVQILESRGTVSSQDMSGPGGPPFGEIVFDDSAHEGAAWYDINISFITVPITAGMPIQPHEIGISHLRVRSYIDGNSSLRVENDRILWNQYDGSNAAPGRSGDVNLPTVFNDLNYGYDDDGDGVNDGYAWTPIWCSTAQGWESTPGEFGAFLGGGYSESISFGELGLESVFRPDMQTKMQTQTFEGRGAVYADALSMQGQLNGDISFDDSAYAGAAWYDVNVLIVSVATPQITLRAEVLDENGSPIYTGYDINWYEMMSGNHIASGNYIRFPADQAAGVDFEAKLVLRDELSREYREPGRQPVFLRGFEHIASFALEKIPPADIGGRVTDARGVAMPGAEITIAQQFNDHFSDSQSLVSDEAGTYAATLKKVNASVTVSKPGYFDVVIPNALTPTSPDSVELRTARLIPDDTKAILLSPIERKADVGGEGETTALDSFANIDFTLRNVTRGAEMPTVRAQYPYLILFDEDTDEGDVIEIVASDRLDRTVAEPLRVTLDENLNAEAEIEFVERGAFTASAPGDNIAMVFDASGAYVQNEPFTDMVRSKPLAEGNYTVVFLEDTKYLTKVSHIDKLTKLNLEEGTDFTQKTVAIQNGEIVELDKVDIPKLDAEKLFYTKTALFTSNKSAVGAGFVTYRLEYELDDKYTASDETLSIELSKGLAFYENAVTFDGKAADYTYEAGILTVKTDARGGVLRFCATPTEAGEQTAYAFLEFSTDGADILQPLGEADVTMTPMQLNYPKKTARQTVNISGVAEASASVTVYDNDVKIAQTTANLAGRWSVTADLYKPYNFSTHQIRAMVTNDRGDRIQAEEGIIEYNKNYPDISKVTMYNLTHTYTENATEIDFLNPSDVIPYYPFDPSSSPVFTFVVEFSNPEAIGDHVGFVVTGANGEKRRVPATYAEGMKAWVGRASFVTENRPAKVGVEFSENPEAISFEPNGEAIDDMVREDLANIENLLSMAPEDLELFSDVMQSVMGDMGITMSFEPDPDYTDEEIAYGTETVKSDGEVVARTTRSPLPEDVTREDLLAQGFEAFPESEYFKDALFKEDGSVTTYVYLDSRLKVVVDYPDGTESTPSAGSEVSPKDVDTPFNMAATINAAMEKEKAAQAELERMKQS
ncbi:MAG: carboxypeptidase-like regulatory domain-containing protein, partial [Clostridiales Family XIII bacterium]|nr:carboxypeptidase-like regulatory domain-containing protein [Clostridiales Family XIII bacterium]